MKFVKRIFIPFILLLIIPIVAICQQRPNIIFILTDDQRWDALGAAGNKIIQTPNLDHLAEGGILYKNAYVTTSICCVSRASLLSGQYQSRHKINDFKADFSPEAVQNTYPLLLKQIGYKIGFVGKYGVGENPPISYFDYWSCTHKTQPDYLLKNKEGKVIHNTDSVSSDISIFLDRFAQQGPFCLSIGFKAPHEQDGNPPQFITQTRFDSLYNNIKIQQPETAEPKYWNSFPDFFRNDSNIARVRWKPLFATDSAYQETVKRYYRLVTGVDEAIGRMVAHLKKLGIDKNTIIIFMGDNGFYLGEHGMEGKWYGHEESIRVPLIIYDPRLTPGQQGKACRKMALNIDIAPTILTAAGVKVPRNMQGMDLIALAKGAVPERQEFFYEHHYEKAPRLPQSEGVITATFKYLKYTEFGYEELYNTSVDPHEKRNLATEQRYLSKLNDMRKKYAVWKEAVK